MRHLKARLLSGMIFLFIWSFYISLCVQASEESSKPYSEALRPQFHFTYKSGWLNDVNGPFYHKGEYHLFTQYSPGSPGPNLANMHWGHAVSKDLLHWQELPPVVAPDERGPAFSGGGAVFDRDNVLGLKTGEEDVIVAFYTAATYMLQKDKPGVQCMVYSNDGGNTWTKYEGNPVVGPITLWARDPKAFRHEPTKRWIMILTLNSGEWNVDNRFMTLWSDNLKEWHELQRFEMPTACDCPDMFELSVDGDPDRTRWVVSGGDTTYMIGSFDGEKFVREGEIHTPPIAWTHQGAGGYAAQTFSNTPQSDQHRIQMSWLQQRSPLPDMPFAQQLTFPYEVTLKTFEEGIRLCRYPYSGIKQLHDKAFVRNDITLKPDEEIVPDFQSDTFDIDLRFKPGEAKQIRLQVRGVEILYDVASEKISCSGSSAVLSPIDGRIELRVLVDRCSIEIFGNGGKLCMCYGFPLDATQKSVRLTCEGSPVEIPSFGVYSVKSIWNN